MESVIFRSAFVYIFVFLIFRASGKRALSQITTFDLILMLIISEATSNALLDDDHSLTGAVLAICTLIGIDQLISFLSMKSGYFDKILNGVPVIVFAYGKPIPKRMQKAGIKEEDLIEAARRSHGLENVDQIKHAIIEKDGSITIIPK